MNARRLLPSTLALALSLGSLSLGAPAAFAQPGQTGAGHDETTCAARYKAEHPNWKDRTTAGQQAFVSQCVRTDVKAENSGVTGAHEQSTCAARYKAAHPNWKDRTTAGQQAYVTQCMQAFMSEHQSAR